MKVLGLTGGIGSGKSTVGRFFQEEGAFVINADLISHQIFDLYPQLQEELRRHFGNDIFQPEGKVDRRRLGTLVFSDAAKRKELENLVHPYIRKEISRQIDTARQSGAALALVDAALLVETGYYKNFEGLIVIETREEQQKERIKKRDGLKMEEIENRMKAQAPLSEKLKVADWVIDNSKDLENTQRQVKKLFAEITSPS
ncbi:MAG: dephospho-CoA kinase [bacterium]